MDKRKRTSLWFNRDELLFDVFFKCPTLGLIERVEGVTLAAFSISGGAHCHGDIDGECGCDEPVIEFTIAKCPSCGGSHTTDRMP